MRRAAAHEEKDDALGPRFMMRLVQHAGDRGGERARLQQRRDSRHAEAGAGARQKVATGAEIHAFAHSRVIISSRFNTILATAIHAACSRGSSWAARGAMPTSM